MTETHGLNASGDEQTTNRPGYDCPTCDRPTLGPAADEIATWRCGCCGERVTETGGEA